MNRYLYSFLLAAISTLTTTAQQWYPLYQGPIPNNLTDTTPELYAGQPNDVDWYFKVTKPMIQVFTPAKEKANGTALLLFPGGGYGGLAWKTEGTNMSKTFNEKGITCFIVKYRLPNHAIQTNAEQVPLSDAIAAMYWVKQHAQQYNIDTTKIGAIGFSAGGHLAATFANLAPINAKPAFSILVYPVITMQQPLTHMGSRTALLGQQPTPDSIDRYSNELQVTDHTPPTYITHTGDDNVVPVQNSIALYEALQRHQINSELHLFPTGNHGFILHQPTSQWLDPMIKWLNAIGMTKPDIDGTGRHVILTFDDASQSHYSTIPSMLKQFNFGATFYVCEFPPDFADSTKYMTWPQMRQLSKMGYEIANHTGHHTGITGLPAKEAESETAFIEAKCKQWGIPKPTSFCYPGYGTDSAFLPILKKHGYQTARTGGDRPWNPKTDHPYYVPAYTINGNNPAYFYNALSQATTDNVIVFCVHGVPDNAHDWVSTPPEIFRQYLQYLHDHHFTVTSMRDYLKKYPQRVIAGPSHP